jgi:hypothetical protein
MANYFQVSGMLHKIRYKVQEQDFPVKYNILTFCGQEDINPKDVKTKKQYNKETGEKVN